MSTQSDEPLNRSDARQKELSDGKGKLNRGTVSIVIALIGVIGSVAVALITTRSSFQSQLKARSTQAILNPIDIQAGHAAMQRAESKDCDLDKRVKHQSNEPLLARICPLQVTFRREFSDIPKVIVSINYLDSDKDENTRVWVQPTDITTSGFVLQFRTWSDSRVFDVEVDWIAFQQK